MASQNSDSKGMGQDNDVIFKLLTTSNRWRCNAEKNILFRVRSIINRLLPSNFDSMFEELIALEIDTPIKKYLVAVHIVDTALDMPVFCDIIANLIENFEFRQKCINHNLENGSEEQKLKFLDMIMEIVKERFQQSIRFLSYNEEELLSLCSRYKSNMPQEIATIIRFRACALMVFIGALFNHSLVTANFISDLLDNLFALDTEGKFEFLCYLIKTIGKKYEQSLKNENNMSSLYSLEKMVEQFETVIAEKSVKPRTRFLLQDIIDLRESNWIYIRKCEMIVVALKQKRNKNANSTEILQKKHNKDELYQSLYPWCPSTPEIVNIEETLISRKIMGLLNRLVSNNFYIIYNEIKLQINTSNKHKILGTITFETAIKTPKLIDSLVKMVHLFDLETSFPRMRMEFIFRTQKEFKNYVCSKIDSGNENTSLSEKSKDSQFSTRLRKCTIIKLIGELFNHKMLTKKVVNNCMKDLISTGSDENFECLYYLILQVGEKFGIPDYRYTFRSPLKPTITKIKEILQYQNRTTENLSVRMRCLLKNIIYCSENQKWRSRFEPYDVNIDCKKRRKSNSSLKILSRCEVPTSTQDSLFFRNL